MRCNCGLLVPWGVPPGWLAGQEVSLCSDRGAVRSCLCSLPGLFLLLLSLPGKCKAIWGSSMQSLGDSNEENFSFKISKKIWLVLQWVFYVGYILYKVSLIQYFCISLFFSENVLQYSARAFMKWFGRWEGEATTLLSSYTKHTVGRKKQINTIFIYSSILDKGFLCFPANISSSWPLRSILAMKFLKADMETLLCNCSTRVWTWSDGGYTAMKKGTHPRGESYFAFNRDGKGD